jgi:DNA-binding MarR family transcriptional regulator
MSLKDEGIRSCLEFARAQEGVDAGALERGLEFICLAAEIDRLMSGHFERHGLSKTRLSTLEMLFHQPDRSLTPAEIADGLSVTRAAMTSVLDGLETEGYVVRERRPGDRRLVHVRLTRSGIAFCEDILPEHYRGLCSILKRLTPDEQETITLLYGKLAEGVRELCASDET